MLRIWEAHTVVAKSPQMLPDAGIQRIGPQQGLFLDALLSSRSKADTCLPACLCIIYGWVSTMRFTRAHMCAIHGRIHLVLPIKVPPATKSSVPAMKCAVPRAQKSCENDSRYSIVPRRSAESLFLRGAAFFFLVGGMGENACYVCLLPKTLLDRRARPHPVKRSPQLDPSYDRNISVLRLSAQGARSSRWRVKSTAHRLPAFPHYGIKRFKERSSNVRGPAYIRWVSSSAIHQYLYVHSCCFYIY